MADYFGQSTLQYAAGKGYQDVMQILIQQGEFNMDNALRGNVNSLIHINIFQCNVSDVKNLHLYSSF